MGFKYIVFELLEGECRREIPIIFPDCMVHSEVAKAVKSMDTFESATPISAGDIDLDGLLRCSGKSETLRLTSRESDASLIGAFPYAHGLL